MDNLFTGYERNLAGVNHQFVHGSVENKAIVNNCVNGKDVVFHLASRNIIVSNYDLRGDINVFRVRRSAKHLHLGLYAGSFVLTFVGPVRLNRFACEYLVFTVLFLPLDFLPAQEAARSSSA